jgi:cyclopropane-fatty-acyl-phospholipid synthase
VADVFALAGIQIGGSRPWDLQVHDERFYQRLLLGGALAAGESYMDGWWDAEALDELCTRVHSANLPSLVGGWQVRWLALAGRILNRQRMSRAAEVAHVHYDRGNDIYQAMLDRQPVYLRTGGRDHAGSGQETSSAVCRKLNWPG